MWNYRHDSKFGITLEKEKKLRMTEQMRILMTTIWREVVLAHIASKATSRV